MHVREKLQATSSQNNIKVVKSERMKMAGKFTEGGGGGERKRKGKVLFGKPEKKKPKGIRNFCWRKYF